MRTNLLISAVIMAVILSGCSSTPGKDPDTLRFDLGNGKASRGFIKVGTDSLYKGDATFGFPEGQSLQAMNGFITSEKPFVFMADVPEGNYDVKITAIGMEGNSTLTIKAESRRLMLKDMNIPQGETRTLSFTTNVRFPGIGNGKEVRRKPREYGHFNWDKSLAIEFGGTRPAVSSIEISRNDTAITIFLAGNSTVTDQRHEPYSAWGQMLPLFFKPGLVAVANHAESGEALKSFIGENRLEKLESQVRAGDYLFIQFAHNDQKPASSAYSAPFSDYQEYLKRYISEARSLGAKPVLVTPMLRRNFDEEGRVINTHGDYPEAIRQVANQDRVPLIDLFAMSKILYEALGPENSKKLFVHFPAGSFPGQEKELKDNTHHSTYGGYELAKCVVKGIQDVLPELAYYLLDGLPEYDPSDPADFALWDLPLSPSFYLETPEGN